MKRLIPVLLSIVMIFILAACGSWQVQVTEATPAYENAIPEELALLAKRAETNEERDEQYTLEQTVNAEWERTDLGVRQWVNCSLALRAINELSLRPAETGENAGVTVPYPFTLTVSSAESGEALVTYDFSGNEITVNGTKSMAQNPDAMQEILSKPFLGCRLFRLGEALPFTPEEVVSITVLGDEGFVYEAEPWQVTGEDAVTGAEYIANWVISDSLANPDTGGSVEYIFTLRDGREIKLYDMGIVGIDDVIGERADTVGEKGLEDFMPQRMTAQE